MDLGSDCDLSRPQAADSPTVEAPLPKNRKRERVRVRGRFASDAARSGDGHGEEASCDAPPVGDPVGADLHADGGDGASVRAVVNLQVLLLAFQFILDQCFSANERIVIGTSEQARNN